MFTGFNNLNQSNFQFINNINWSYYNIKPFLLIFDYTNYTIMKTEQTLIFLKRVLLLVAIIFVSNSFGQAFNDDTEIINEKEQLISDTSFETSYTELGIEKAEQKDKNKARSSFKIFAGASFNSLNLASNALIESSVRTGYMIGASYKRGKFFYYEFGARFNKNAFELADISSDQSEDIYGSVNVSALDIPISVGINLTSYVDRLIGVRLFISAVPSFVLDVKNDEGTATKDNVNSFLMRGQAGIGIDITVIFIELGFNYGFNDVLNDIQSNPTQGFVGLGFRF